MTRVPAPARRLLGGLACAVALATGVQAAPGDPVRGRALFEAKHCARCHAPRGQPGTGPALEELRRPQGAFELAGRLWNHAPAMFARLTEGGLPWPEIGAAEMADLMAYLEAAPARDRAPDLFKGETTLVQKGCLKCHSLRREGARVAPDFAERRVDYDSAPDWAARMWRHTPGMAAKARELGILYPRFSDDEMRNLVAFLRTATIRQ